MIIGNKGPGQNPNSNIIRDNTAGDCADLYIDRFAVLDHLRGFNNNYSEMYGAWTESGGNVDLSPQFVAPGTDYHLLPDSQMIDRGTGLVSDPPGIPPFDAEGDPRVLGEGPDIGADEVVTTIAPDVKANLRDGLVTLSTSDIATITVALSNGTVVDNADWWLAVQVPVGHLFLTPTGWTSTVTPFMRGPLFRVRPMDLFSIPLADFRVSDEFTVFFGVDIAENGLLDMSSHYFDFVTVRITD